MLEQDIKNYIEETIPGLKGRLFPVLTTDISEISVLYSITDVSAGHMNQSQLTLTVVWKDYDACVAIHEELKEILAMEEDEPFCLYGDTKFHSELSAGGGALFNDGPQMWEVSKYYILNWRKKNG